MKRAANSVAARIRARIEEIPAGQPFLSGSFLELGERAAVDQTLSRLVRGGQIERVSRGIFVRPRQSRFMGKVPPAPIEVARAVAGASGSRVQISGAEAARRLELTTQVPTQSLFLTTGPSKRFAIGRLEVQLRHASRRKLVLAGRPAGEALSALWFLGKREVTRETFETIRRKLSPAEYKALISARGSMPGWMARALPPGGSLG